MPRKLVPCVLLLLAPSMLSAQGGWFPYTAPWSDSSRSVTDASDLLLDYPAQDPAAVIDSRGFLRAGADGHFYFEKTGRRARFWGVNFTFNADYPPCPDEPLRSGEYPDQRVSDKVAAHLAKLGVNVVRFHHMDYYAAPNGIWDPKEYPNNTQHLDAGQLRRFDYLVYQLRKRGIYTNINLKVARHFGPGDGIDPGDVFKGNLGYFQGVSHWNARMVELQKDYARQLLTHRNPYSGFTYAEDPAVAFIEIANEDSLFGNLTWDGGLNYVSGVDGCLPERYSRELDLLFNNWLSSRYRDRADLDSAWRASDTVGDTTNRIRNGGFEDGMSGWTVQQLGTAKALAKVETGAGSNGTAALRVDVTSDGTNWHVQAFQNGHSIAKDHMYEFSFKARASSAVDVAIDIMKGADPWQNYGLSKTVRLSAAWQQFTAQFRANETDTSTVRPTFELGAQTATVWIDDIEFREASPKGLQADEDPAAGTVRRPMKSELGGYSNPRVIDLFRFYTEIDETYFGGMRAHIKESLGSRAMVTGTAPWWGFLGDTAVQSRMDYVDTHYYWDHPSWPGVPAWSATGWRITNQPWINSIDQFAGIAAQAVEGKPLVLSEFNHVFPNRYALEGPLLAALIGNLQDWDGIYMFDYASSTSAFDDSYTTSFFSMAGNPIKTAQLPVASRIFLSRQSIAAPQLVPVELNRSELAIAYAQGLVDARRFLSAKGLPAAAYLQARLRIRTFDRTSPAPIAFSLPDGDVASGGRELLWKRSANPRSSMIVNGSGIQGGIGFLKGARQDHGDWDYEVTGDSPDHLAVILQSRDAVALRETRHMILSVWTEHQNTGMGWNSDQTSVDNRWGSGPTIVRSAKVTVRFRLAGARVFRLWALDDTGARKAELSQQKSGGTSLFEIDTARDGAVSYEIEVNDASSPPEFAVSSPGTFQLYTEAAGEQLQVGWAEVQNKTGAAVQLASLLEYSSRGVLTSSVRLPASPATSLSRAPVIRTRYVDTAVALLNRQSSTITVGMRLRRADGTIEGGEKTVNLPAGSSTAFFVREKFDVPDGFEGLLEFSSSSPFHVVTLRSIVNAAGDFALTPYPAESSPAGPLFLPHLVSDGSYSTDLLFWNSQLQPLAARLDFFGPDGKATPAGSNAASLEVRLQPGQFRRVPLTLSNESPFYGYARLTLTSGPALPASTAVITRWEGGAPVSEAGLPATPAVTDAQLVALERPNQQTGLALLNTSNTSVTVECEISGTEQTLPRPSRTAISLQPGEKRPFFLYQVLPDLPRYLTGILHIRASGPIAALALLGLNNERGNFLISALTGEPGLGALDAGGTAVLPRIAVGAGYRTLFLIFPDTSGTSQGLIRFFDANGGALPLLFR